METYKILIVEDEILIAEDISDMLKSFGIKHIKMCHDKQSALNKIKEFHPNVVLLDIRLEGENTGLQIGATIKKEYQIPFIYITSHSDLLMLKKIMETEPFGYLSKPIKKSDLLANLLLLKKNEKENTNILIKEGNKTIVIKPETISYIKSYGNYIIIYCDEKKYLTRKNLDEIFTELDATIFFKAQRSYIVNLKKIAAYSKNEITINDCVIPISRLVLKDFIEKMNNLNE